MQQNSILMDITVEVSIIDFPITVNEGFNLNVQQVSRGLYRLKSISLHNIKSLDWLRAKHYEPSYSRNILLNFDY